MFAAIGILGRLVDLAGLAYLLRLVIERWGTGWHGMKSILWLAGILVAVLVGSAVLFWCGVMWAGALLAAGPAIIAAAWLAAVFALYALGSGHF